MNNPQNIDELIARLEAVTGSSRALDTEIAMAFGRAYQTSIIDVDGTKVRVPWYPDMFRPGRVKFAPCYTGSIDAALTLIPTDAFWHVLTEGGGSGFQADVVWKEHDGRGLVYVHGATPALAVCIAALKARRS